MNDVRALTESILIKTRAEAEAILHKAAAEADKIISEAEEKAKTRRNKIGEDYKRKAEDLDRRTKIEVELETKKRSLAAKHRVIREVFDEALAALKNLPAEKRIRFLAEKLAAAGMNGGGEVKGSGSPEEWNSIVKVANEIMARSGSISQMVLSSDQPDIDGGFILAGRGFTINGSYQALLEELEEALIPEVAGFLFEEEKG